MTPDGNPIIGKVDNIEGYINAVGMCEQGFMLGPGMAELIYRLITESYGSDDLETLKSFDPYRDFKGKEVFK